MINQSLINGFFFMLIAVIGWFVRGTISRNEECQRHNERRIQELASSVESWKLSMSLAHERLAGDAKVQEQRHIQNQAAIERLTNKVERALESVPAIIGAAQSDIVRRIVALEKGND